MKGVVYRGMTPKLQALVGDRVTEAVLSTGSLSSPSTMIRGNISKAAISTPKTNHTTIMVSSTTQTASRITIRVGSKGTTRGASKGTPMMSSHLP